MFTTFHPLYPRVLSLRHSSIPANSLEPIAQSRSSEQWRCRCVRARCWAATIAAKRLQVRTLLVGLIAALLTVELPSRATAESLPASPSSKIVPTVPYAPFVSEACRRFTIPEHWIRTVLKTESGANAHAVSLRGPLGLMQIMPVTWIELSVRYELGIDPFDPHDNILAWTAFLREMLDRFGTEGFLAVYNAGPGRYEKLLATSRRLPKETLAYVRAIESEIGIKRRQFVARFDARAASPLEDAVAAGPSTTSSAGKRSTAVAHQLGRFSDLPKLDASALIPRATGLFVQPSAARLSR
ncbi:lytic transglycosylase domain-containing protein [Bradyrhizobium sp. Ec3.3]|uniref:lytic transglycosylase domain-containing protein n=1 Tax=Bradyrhizobium sp. Ec3.3 TaxID=189753 RepID=UPI0007C4E688|nr:lytic transglycosylase domain-containing protein [Bradyrhizobium sp. Ec3.3]